MAPKCEFVGHVENIDTSGEYESSIVISDEAIEGSNFVNHIKFLITKKKSELLNKTGLNVGAKVKVIFYVTGITGESKKTGKEYQINKLLANDIIIIEGAMKKKQEDVQTESEEPLSDDDSDIPF